MLLLVPFAFLAGLATIFAPCILPILPVALSAGVTGGKRRPLGIITGLVVSFTFFTLALGWLTRHLGLGPNALRDVAIVVLLGFGVVLLIPKLLVQFEVLASRLIPPTQADSSRTDFWGGIVIGISLGLVWTPCVGPIVASVIALSATSAVSGISIFILAAYALGTGVPLLILTYAGQGLLKRVRSMGKYTARIQMVFGAIMVLTAVSMLFGLDRTVQNKLLADLPSSISSGLTQRIEEGSLVQNQIKALKGVSTAQATTAATGSSGLPVLGMAPNFTGIDHWLNSPPLTISQLRGKVVLVDFWTYSCINCLRTLPHVTSWYNAYASQGFVVVGVHSPEFAFEKDTANVAQAIQQNGITYPVAQDNELATWNAYNNEYWPAEYLIDAQGRIREETFGEGGYDTTEKNIQALLAEAKGSAVTLQAPSVPNLTPDEPQSPETYLGTDRQSGYETGVAPSALDQDSWSLTGDWTIGSQYITSGKAGDTISYRFIGDDAYLVINPPAAGGTLQVTVDGKPAGTGTDASNGVISLNEDRLYHLAHVGSAGGDHILTLTFQTPATKAFSFTFG
jgi:cytochrome c biogenesis protein CcdA/thiol-disulfide isomerase/thioredoxin